MLAFHAIWKVLLAFGWSTIISHLSNCEPVRGPTDCNVDEDYDIHVPLSALPLGVNVGPSLEILSFRSDQETGELPWIAHRGWLAVGDVLVSLEGEDISAFNPGDFAEAVQMVVEAKKSSKPFAVPASAQHQQDNAAGHITFRVRPGAQARRSMRAKGMYSPPTQEESDEEHARWHLTYSIGPLSAEKANVTVSAFGSKPESCDPLPVVVASPEDGCSSLLNVEQVVGAHILVRRGGCSFLAKALRISHAGGRSLVVIDEGAGRLKMEAEQRQTVTIPVVMVSKLEGESLRKAATSTSRATGKVTATLVTTVACLSQNAPPQQQTPPQRPPPPIVEATASPIGIDRVSGGTSSDWAVPTSKRGRWEEAATETVANKDVASSARTLLGGGAQGDDGEASEGSVATADVGAITSGNGEEGFALCRQKSSGPLRGGDLILRARHRPGLSVEFVSSLLSGPLWPINRPHGESRSEGNSADSNDALLVSVLDSGCNFPTREAQSVVNGTVLLLPPDPECSVPNQLRVGGGLGAAVLVVVAGAAEDNLVSVASSATTSLFTGKTPNGVESPSTVLVENSVDTSGSGEDRPNPERAQQSGNIEGRRGASVDVERGVLGSVAGFASGPSAAPEERPGDTCSPLTVVVGNEEGERVLEWLRGARGAGKDRDTGGDDGEGSVAASLVKREDVGKLWGDVLWASDPRNWPAGAKQRRRILNRMRKTHSTEHAGRKSRTGNATRWSLLEKSYAALDGTTSGTSRPQAAGKEDPSTDAAAAAAAAAVVATAPTGAETEL